MLGAHPDAAVDMTNDPRFYNAVIPSANLFTTAEEVSRFYQMLLESREGWSHPPGSNLVGWAKRQGNSPIVYLPGGDDASAMANPHFRQFVHNAVRWVSSDAARMWARSGATD